MFVADCTSRPFPVVLPVLVVSVLGAAGCWSSHADWADGETPEAVVSEDEGAAEDATGLDDAGVPDDGGIDDGADPDDASFPCPEGWYDPTSGLCWQEPPAGTLMTWYDAVSYCENLVLGGHPVGTWHLPTISELRSLIRGCPATETGGECGVTDECLGEGCGSWGPCNGCWGGGPGYGGCYCSPELAYCGGWYWSSSSYSGSSSYAWRVGFSVGYVGYFGKSSSYYVRCIRRGP